MSASDVIGYATLQVIPSLKGISGNLGSAIGAPLVAAGKKAGDDTAAAIESGLKRAEQAAEKAAVAIEKARGKEADAAGKVTVAEAQLQALRDKGVTDVGKLAAAEQRVEKAKRDHEAATRTVERAEKDHAQALKDVESAAKNTADSMDDVGGRSLLAADNISKFGAAAAAAAAAAGAALFAIGSDFNDMSNSILVGTGASGEALDGLIESAKVVGTTVPAEFSAVGDAIANLNTYTGATGESLERLSTQVLDASRMLGEDGVANSAAFGKALVQWNMSADDGADALDGLFVATQAYGIGLGDLTKHLNSYGAILNNAGYSMEEAAIMFGNLDKAGLSVSRIMPALNASMRTWAGEGRNVKDALSETVDQIRETEDTTQALAIATDVFGAQGAQRLTTAIRNGTFVLEDFETALGDTDGAIASTSGEVRTMADGWLMLKNQAMAGIEPLATGVFDAILGGMNLLSTHVVPALTGFGGAITGVFEPAFDTVRLFFGALTGEGYDTDIPWMNTVIDAAAFVRGAFDELIGGITAFAAAFKAGGDDVTSSGFAGALEQLGLWARSAWDALSAFGGWLNDNLVPVIVAFGGAVFDLYTNYLSGLVGVLGTVGSAVMSVAGFLIDNKEIVMTVGAAVAGFFVPALVAMTAQLTIQAGQWMLATARMVAFHAIGTTITVATKAWAAAQWLLNAAMSANPIGLIIAALAGLAVGLKLAWDNSETFRSIVIGAFEGVKNAVGAAWEGIKSAVSAVWEGFLKPTFEALSTAARAVGDSAMWLWQNAIMPAWDGIKSFVSAVWNDWIKPVLDNWVTLGQIVGGAVMAMWQNYIAPAWEGIKSAISAAYDGVIRPVLDAVSAAFTWVGETASALWNNYIVPAWQGIGSAIQTVWDSTVSVVTGAIETAFNAVGTVASWLYNEAIKPAWDGIQSAISSVWGFLEPIFGKIGDGMNGIGSIASSVAEGIRSAFAGVVDVLKAPVRYVGSLLTRIPAKVGPFNVPGAASLNEWGASLQALRTGGVVAGRRPDGMLYGPGTGTSDSILGVDPHGMPTALVSTNEFVVNAKATAENLPLLKMINAGWVPSAEFLKALVFEGDFRDTGVKIDESSDFVARVLGARSLIVDGDYTGNVYDGFGVDEDDPRIAQVLGLRSLLAEGDYTGNLYDGFGWDEDSAAVDAILTAREALDKLPRFADGGLVTADELVDFAKGVEGAPYEWGGVNWGDCSGAVSALANFATGRDPFASRFATGTMDSELAKRGFLPGLGPEGSLNVGWFNGGPYGGHTSATLPNGVNFEMGGARGNGQYGGQAAGADDPQYTDHAHLPPDFFVGGDLGSPTFGGSLSDGVSWSMGGGSGASVSGGGSLGGSSGTSSSVSGGSKSLGVALVDATPVWVTNWPSGASFGGGSSSSTGAAGTAFDTGKAGGSSSGTGAAASFTRDDLTADIAGSESSFTRADLTADLAGPASPFTDAVFGKLEEFGVSADKLGKVGAFGLKAGELAGQIGAAAHGGPVDVDALRGNTADMLTLGGEILEPEQPLGGAGVDSSYGAGGSDDPGTDKWADWAKNAAGQWESFFKDNWREMVNTAVGVGLGGIGNGGGGDTYNINGPDANAVGRVIARNQRRRSIANQRMGGFGR